MKVAEFEVAAEQLVHEIEDYKDFYALPDEWFAVPDHVAIKCASGSDYESTIDAFEEKVEQISEVRLDGRRLASARLLRSVAVGSLGAINWVEIMEPRPEKVGRDFVGVEHMEFYFPTFDDVRDVLSDRNIAYEEQGNLGHEWLNIVINEEGQELKINNRPLSEIVARELDTSQATIVK